MGGIVFFSFVATPTVFSQLPKETGSQFLSALFPKYYLYGYLAGGLLLITTVLQNLMARSGSWTRVFIVLLMLGNSIYAGMVLRPKIHDLKVQIKAVEEGTPMAEILNKDFRKLHRLSVILNMLVLLGAFTLTGMLALHLRP